MSDKQVKVIRISDSMYPVVTVRWHGVDFPITIDVMAGNRSQIPMSVYREIMELARLDPDACKVLDEMAESIINGSYRARMNGQNNGGMFSRKRPHVFQTVTTLTRHSFSASPRRN